MKLLFTRERCFFANDRLEQPNGTKGTAVERPLDYLCCLSSKCCCKE